MKKILTIIIVVVALQLGVVSVASASGGSYHKVRYGDTLYSIARYYGTSVYKISEVNGLYNPNHIYAGQVLYIPAGGYGHGYPDHGDCYSGCGHTDHGYKSYHRVHYGETLYSIGRRYDVHPNHIADVNNLYNPNYIYAGQVLYIPSGSSYPYPYGKYGHGKYGHGKDGYGKYGHGKDGYGKDGYDHGGYDRGYDYGRYDHGSKYGQGYGYDYTGYYYNRGGKHYSFTCGYNYNCW